MGIPLGRIIQGLGKARLGHLKGIEQAEDQARQEQLREEQRVREEADRKRMIDREALALALQGVGSGAAPADPSGRYQQLTPGFHLDTTRTPEGRKAAAEAAERKRREDAFRAAGIPDAKIPAVMEIPSLADNILFPPKPPQEKQPEPPDAGPIRTQFNADQTFRNASVVAENYGRIQEAANDPSAAGDLALIFSYMKLLDPGSTVREGEFANAENAGGVPSRVRNLWNRAMSGERLTPEQRADFLGSAKGAVKAQRESLRPTLDRYTAIARAQGVDPSMVIHDPLSRFQLDDGAAPPAGPPAPSRTAPASPAPRMQSGTPPPGRGPGPAGQMGGGLTPPDLPPLEQHHIERARTDPGFAEFLRQKGYKF